MYIESSYNSNSGPLSVYLVEDDLLTFELLVDFLYYRYHVTTVLTEIILDRLPSHEGSRIETLMNLYKMGCKYQVPSLMEYCVTALALMNTHKSVFFRCIVQVAAVSDTAISFSSENDVQRGLYDFRSPRHLPMFNESLEGQYLPHSQIVCTVS